MPTSESIGILLAHDKWATQQILGACAKLTTAQFHQRFEIGPGSLHDTTTHILSSMRYWGDILATRPFRPLLEIGHRSTAQLLKLLDEIAHDLALSAKNYPPSQLVSLQRGDKTYEFPRAGVLAHIATHGMHHRAQCLNMLRKIGVKTLPPSSVTEWMRLVDRPLPND